MRLRLLLALAALSLCLASFEAAAQGQATVAISVVDLAPTATMNAGQVHSASFAVNVMVSGLQCTAPATMVVDVALSGAGAAPLGVTPTIEPANLTFTIPGPAVYGAPVPGLPVGEPYNESQAVTLRVATTIEAQGVYPATVSASFAGGEAMGCVPSMLPAASSSPANHQLTIVNQGTGTNTTPPPVGPGTGTGNNTTQPPPPPTRTPGFEPLVLFGAGALAVVARRRRG